MKHKLCIAYDGGGYSGWQIQPNAPSIQEELEKALSLLCKEQVRVIGSGRTDQGAHALAQVAHFTSGITPPLLALNGVLPPDIRVKTLEIVPDSFHAQYSATGKIYHYHIWLERIADPFIRRYRYHFPYPLSMELVEEASSLFVGRHDFKTFANVGSNVKSTTRHLKKIDVVPQEGGFRLEFEGEGFLYKMVRNIVGTLLEVATHKRPLEDILELFAKKDRRLAGTCAPAHALFLMQVFYGASSNEEMCAKSHSSASLAIS
ncbi:MAG: tRNA pseudouridine(38-40) synthase TruA [Chlamydiales bacterium]